MSYTLRGRVETRLAGALLPFLAACVIAVALPAWWPLELAGVMVAVGLALDAVVYHRLLPYQAGWLAVPLGLLELAVTVALVRVLGIAAPLEPALWFFAASWLVAQLLGHAGLPLLRLTYPEDGGELGRAGIALSAAAPVALVGVLGVAWATLPPLVRLPAGTHDGPLVIDRPERLVGEDGAIVRGGIVIHSDDVTVRNVTVLGGESGISIDDAGGVLLDDVRIVGAELDGIHVRRSTVTIRDCDVSRMQSDYSQGIDISFSMHRAPSVVDGCRVEGTWEGIVSHSSQVMLRDNTVRATTSRAIAVTEMSMGSVERNVVSGTRPDHTTEDGMRDGYAIQAHFNADAEVDDNTLADNVHDHGAFAGGRISPR